MERFGHRISVLQNYVDLLNDQNLMVPDDEDDIPMEDVKFIYENEIHMS